MNQSDRTPFSILNAFIKGAHSYDITMAFPDGALPFGKPLPPWLHLSYMRIRKPSLSVSILNSDPNTNAEDAVWLTADVRLRKPRIRPSRWIPVVSTHPSKAGRYSVKRLNSYQSDADLKALAAIANIENVNYFEIFRQDGIKYIHFSHYYYHAGELEPGNGLPFRCVTFKNAELPLSEFLEGYRNDPGFVDLVQQKARQYIEDISAEELIKGVCADLQTYKKATSFNSTDTADDYPYGLYWL